MMRLHIRRLKEEVRHLHFMIDTAVEGYWAGEHQRSSLMRSVFFPSSSRHQPEIIRKEVSIERKTILCVRYQNSPNNPSITLLQQSCTILVLHERLSFTRIKQQGTSFKNRFILKYFFKTNLCIQFLSSHNAYYVRLVQCCQ